MHSIDTRWRHLIILNIQLSHSSVFVSLTDVEGIGTTGMNSRAQNYDEQNELDVCSMLKQALRTCLASVPVIETPSISFICCIVPMGTHIKQSVVSCYQECRGYSLSVSRLCGGVSH